MSSHDHAPILHARDVIHDRVLVVCRMNEHMDSLKSMPPHVVMPVPCAAVHVLAHTSDALQSLCEGLARPDEQARQHDRDDLKQCNLEPNVQVLEPIVKLGCVRALRINVC